MSVCTTSHADRMLSKSTKCCIYTFSTNRVPYYMIAKIKRMPMFRHASAGLDHVGIHFKMLLQCKFNFYYRSDSWSREQYISHSVLQTLHILLSFPELKYLQKQRHILIKCNHDLQVKCYCSLSSINEHLSNTNNSGYRV